MLILSHGIDTSAATPAVYESTRHEFVINWAHKNAVITGKGPRPDVLVNMLKTTPENLVISVTAKACRIRTPVWPFVASKTGSLVTNYDGLQFSISKTSQDQQYVLVKDKSNTNMYDYIVSPGIGVVSFNIYDGGNISESFKLVSGDGMLKSCFAE